MHARIDASMRGVEPLGRRAFTFAPLARINPKMMRLSNGETASVYSCSASREGGLSTGPSKAFSDFETSYYDLAFVSSDGNEEDAREAIKQLASEIESVLKTKWTHFSEEQVAFLVNDVKSMRVVSTPPPKEEKRKKGKKKEEREEEEKADD